MNRSATASLHSAAPKKNVPCNSLVVVVKFFLKKERTFFFGVLPSRSRAGGGTMRTKFCKSYFLGKGFCKTSAHLFLNSDVANGKGGVWGGIFHLLLFLFWRNSGRDFWWGSILSNSNYPRNNPFRDFCCLSIFFHLAI